MPAPVRLAAWQMLVAESFLTAVALLSPGEVNVMKPKQAAANLGTAQYEGVRLFVVLDFDGVINQFPGEVVPEGVFAPTGRHKSVCRTELKEWYAITYSEEMVADLNEILVDPAVQLLWLTTWQHRVIGEMEALGLKTAREPLWLQFLPRMSDYGGVHAKCAVFDDLVEGLPGDVGVIWVDDQAIAVHLAYAQDAPDEPGLLVAADPRYGITRPQMAQIREYAARYTRP